jgi:hypothetical protein
MRVDVEGCAESCYRLVIAMVLRRLPETGSVGRRARFEEGLEQLAQDPELSAHVTGVVHRAGQDEGALEGHEHVVGQGVRVDGDGVGAGG